MKSFRLHVESKRGFWQRIVKLLLGAAASAAICLAVLSVDNPEARSRVVLLAVAAVFVVFLLSRRQLYRALRQHYPHTRGVPLLVLGFSVATLGSLASILRLRADDYWFLLAFPAALCVCIAVFLILNRKDRDVAE